MTLGLDDKTALVTGGSKGIGYGCAEAQGVSVDAMVEQFLAEERPHIEVGRPGTIDEVGRVVAFLASEHASFVNGSNYRVDGGSVAAM